MVSGVKPTPDFVHGGQVRVYSIRTAAGRALWS